MEELRPLKSDLETLRMLRQEIRHVEARTVVTLAWWRRLLRAVVRMFGPRTLDILPLWKRHRLLVSRDLEAAELQRLWRPARRLFRLWER